MNLQEKELLNDLWDLWEKMAECGELHIGKSFSKTYDMLEKKVNLINFNQELNDAITTK
jgi:hypothetical protein